MYNKGYRGERYSTLKRINVDNAGKLASRVHVPAGRARHVLDRAGGVRRHPVRDHAPRHLRDRRRHLPEGVDPPARGAGSGDERHQQGRGHRRGPRDSRHAGRLSLRARREDRHAAMGAAGRRLEHWRRRRRRAAGVERHRLRGQGGRRLGHPRPHDGVQRGGRFVGVGVRSHSDGQRNRRRNVGEGGLGRPWRRRCLGRLRARPRNWHAVRARRQSGTRLQQGDAAGGESFQHFHRGAGRADRQAQVVVPVARQRRPRLGCDRRVAVRRRRQEAWSRRRARRASCT